MKLPTGTSALILALTLGLVAAEPTPAANSCKSNGCVCNTITPPGTYCGGCVASNGEWAVKKMGKGGNGSAVFECMGDDTCCIYGSRDSCPDSPCGS